MTQTLPRCAMRAAKFACAASMLTLTAALTTAPTTAMADDSHTHPGAPEAHAPIMVMGDHRHKAGEYMVSLRRMDMSMNGNIKGTDNIADSAVLSMPNQHANPPMNPPFMRVVPQKMDMKMTMLGAMYAPSDKVTLLAMFMHIENEMLLQAYNNMDLTPCAPFTGKSKGTGDTTLGALIEGGATANGTWHYGLGLSLPTGSIEETGRPAATPMGCNAATMQMRLPYPMQLGSGSYDLKPSLTYNGDWRGWRIGAQANAVLRLNDNDADYRLGDRFEVQGWAMRRLTDWLSASARLDISRQGKMDGQDAAITLPVTTAQTASSGGTYANISLGLNLIGQTGALGGVLAGHRLALEWVSPLHQDANGVQMKRDDTLMLGWQKAF